MATNDNVTQLTDQAQDISRSMFGAFQSIAEVQMNTLQRLGGIQQNLIQQAFEVSNDQLQTLGKMRDPREFASAQADLVKTHGQRYADTIKEAIEVTVDGWEEVSTRVESTTRDVKNKAKKAA